MLGIGLIHKAQGLHDGQILDTPGRDNGAALDLGLYIGAGKTKEAIFAAEDILFHTSVGAGDLEGGEGGIIAFGGEQQIFIIVCFFYLIADQGIHQEAAVLLGDGNADVTVIELHGILVFAAGGGGKCRHR